MTRVSESVGAVRPPRTRGPDRATHRSAPRRARWRNESKIVAVVFLTPAFIALVVLVLWPMADTIFRSLRDDTGTHFVGLANYREMFRLSETRRAIFNNIIWVLVAPTVVTALGLVFAVLSERVRFKTALKTVLFMPMAISFLAAGVTWRAVYDDNPDKGALNAALVTVHDAFAEPALYNRDGKRADPRDNVGLVIAADGAVSTAVPVGAHQPVYFPMKGFPADLLPKNAAPAAAPSTTGGVTGVVWLDFVAGGGGRTGAVDPGERGMPGMHVEVVRDGKTVATTQTDTAGRFAFPALAGDGYTVRLTAANFAAPFRGAVWLGPTLVTWSIIGAYVWIWAGFAMVLIAAGLAAIPREALEAARVDGATEWQVFRRVTIPLVRPVLIVVTVTLMINVLKIFDLVYVLGAGKAEANVVAYEMYAKNYNGQVGLSAALGVLLFLLVLPGMIFNIRNLRTDRR
jgi:alpha-glucoside transport system permease protein